jgi:hypothetical protein
VVRPRVGGVTDIISALEFKLPPVDTFLGPQKNVNALEK